MLDLYGPSFTTIYGEEPSAIWLAEIAKLTDEECRAGLLALASGKTRPADRHSYPANLTEFVEACKPKSAGRRYLGTPVCGSEAREAPRLEAKSAEREHVDRCLASMRQTVAGAEAAPSPGRKPPEPDEAPELLDGPDLEAERVRQLKALGNLKGAREPGEDDES